MHHHSFYTLRVLCRSLSDILLPQGDPMRLLTCFSQSRDELIIGFANTEAQFYIRANLSPELCCLSFLEEFQRARQNTVELFTPLIDVALSGVRQFANERSFALVFADGQHLIFKMHGARANIILCSPSQAGVFSVTELFHNRIEKDYALQPHHLDRHLEQTQEVFMAHGLAACFPTIDKSMQHHLQLGKLSPVEQWEAVSKLHQALLQEPVFYIFQTEAGAVFSLLPTYNNQPGSRYVAQEKDPIVALNIFYQTFARSYFFEREYQDALRELEKRKQKLLQYINKAEEKLIMLELENRYEEIANVLMANLHVIPERATQVRLFNFYTNREEVIKLKEQLSPQKNAEAYYRKAKNHNIEVRKQQEVIATKKQELAQRERQINEIRAIGKLKELRRYLKAEGLSQSQQQETEFPFRRFETDGYEIWVGKSARNNDLLTQRYAFKEDLWLHARDVSGSHVIVKYRAGHNFPTHVIERAAQIAAWYSKRKNDKLCPVIYTPKKFVRKPKGAAEGQVVVDKETVMMVTPQLPE